MSFNEKKSLKEKFEIYAESYAKELDDLELYDLKNFSTNCCPDIIAAGRNGKFWFSKEERYKHKNFLLKLLQAQFFKLKLALKIRNFKLVYLDFKFQLCFS